ncbi:MAG: hypothetical protein CMF69_11695, partial [Magnetovibrio sp.]|nr:hypothetical protein [Magnetovibrio sp.]
EHYEVAIDRLLDNLDRPWGMAYLPDNSILVTERSGNLLLIPTEGERRNVSGIPKVWDEGQGGLLDVAVHPNFFTNQLVYLSFSQPARDGRTAGTALIMGELDLSTSPKLRDTRVIFSQNKKTDSSRHFGSRIVIAPDNSLFLTIGDRGQSNRAQDPFDHAGSVVRLSLDGSVPRDNPFLSGSKALREIWSIGHRNPQGAFWNPSTDSLWTVSHGAKGGDEVNRIGAGKNYGWPIISFGENYWGTKIGEGTHKEGMEQPTYYWDPSIAPSGSVYYEGNTFPKWRENIFVGALKFELIVRLELRNNKVINEERLFKNNFGRIRDVRSGPGEYLYFLTDENPGQLYRIRPN